MSVKETLFPPGNPFASRTDTMFLDVVEGSNNRGKPEYATRHTLLKVDDIMKERRHFSHPPKEPACSEQKTYYPNQVRRPRDLSLCCKDIFLAWPKTGGRKSQRHTDPVQPQYEFPGDKTLLKVDPFVPRGSNHNFILENRDIEKSWPKSLPNPNYVRHNTDVSDIEYTCPNYWSRWVRPVKYPGERRPFYQEPQRAERNYRCTNPLEPVYQVSQKPIASVNAVWSEESRYPQPKEELKSLGGIPGSKPRKLQWSNSEPQLSLMREDVPGAAPQRWIGELPYHMYQPRTDYSKPIMNTITSDIPGAQVGTLKTGLVNIRGTNPLFPTYKLLDGTESRLVIH